MLIDKKTRYVVAVYNTLRGAPHGHIYFCDAVLKSYMIKDALDDEITLARAMRSSQNWKVISKNP
jgi:hypothetical protein